MAFWSRYPMLNVFLVFLGAILLIVGIAMYAMSEGPRSWPTTTGTISESYIVMETSWYPSPSYHPVVEYWYTVDGEIYDNHKIKYIEDASTTDYYLAQAVVEKYPVGSTVTVHYDPGDPNSAVLTVGQGTFTLILLIVAGTLLTIGVGGMAWSQMSKTEVSVGRGMGRGRKRWIDPTSGPSYNFDAIWELCQGESPTPEEHVLWRGTPVKGAFLFTLGRTSMLGFIIMALVLAVPLSIAGLVFDLNSLTVGTVVLLALVLMGTAWWASKQGRKYPGTEYILTDWRIIAKEGRGQGLCRSIPLVNISQVLVARTLVDRIHKTGSLVVSNTTRADLLCVKEPMEAKELIKEAMVKAWERAKSNSSKGGGAI